MKVSVAVLSHKKSTGETFLRLKTIINEPIKNQTTGGSELNPNGEINLVKKSAAGDEYAFNEIYYRHRGRVYGFVHRMTLNGAVAEEITHDAFMVLIERPEQFERQRGTLSTFLCAVARNLMMNHLRRKHHGDVAFDDLENYDPTSEAPRDSPLENLLNRELAAHIDACVAALPPLQREVIVLREFEELSYEEIAMVVGAESGAVKARLHRARQNLAKSLAAYVKAPSDECYELH